MSTGIVFVPLSTGVVSLVLLVLLSTGVVELSTGVVVFPSVPLVVPLVPFEVPLVPLVGSVPFVVLEAVPLLLVPLFTG